MLGYADLDYTEAHHSCDKRFPLGDSSGVKGLRNFVHRNLETRFSKSQATKFSESLRYSQNCKSVVRMAFRPALHKVATSRTFCTFLLLFSGGGGYNQFLWTNMLWTSGLF